MTIDQIRVRGKRRSRLAAFDVFTFRRRDQRRSLGILPLRHLYKPKDHIKRPDYLTEKRTPPVRTGNKFSLGLFSTLLAHCSSSTHLVPSQRLRAAHLPFLEELYTNLLTTPFPTRIYEPQTSPTVLIAHFTRVTTMSTPTAATNTTPSYIKSHVPLQYGYAS
jgi:hypothetical protein